MQTPKLAKSKSELNCLVSDRRVISIFIYITWHLHYSANWQPCEQPFISIGFNCDYYRCSCVRHPQGCLNLNLSDNWQPCKQRCHLTSYRCSCLRHLRQGLSIEVQGRVQYSTQSKYRYLINNPTVQVCMDTSACIHPYMCVRVLLWMKDSSLRLVFVFCSTQIKR